MRSGTAMARSSAGHRIGGGPGPGWAAGSCGSGLKYKKRTLGITDDAMSKPSSLYQQYWSDKRYLKMLTCRKECDLSHPERKLLSYLVYKARDKTGVSTSVIIKAIGLDRRTVWVATSKLVELGLVEKTEQGYRALDPLEVKPEWFAEPHDGKEWWERLRTYRHYLLTHDAKRSRGNRVGVITEMDNAVLWMLYSLGQGGKEIVGQRVPGLAVLLGCSPHTVRDAIGRLTKAGLIMKRSDGFTLLEPNKSVRSWWRDSKKSGVKEQPGVVPIEEDGDQLAWIEPLVAERYGSGSEDDRDTLVRMLTKRCREMLTGKVKPSEVKKYWQSVLDMIPDADRAWDFCALRLGRTLEGCLPYPCVEWEVCWVVHQSAHRQYSDSPFDSEERSELVRLTGKAIMYHPLVHNCL